MNHAGAIIHQYAESGLQGACDRAGLAVMDSLIDQAGHVGAGGQPVVGNRGGDSFCIRQLWPGKAIGDHRFGHLDTREHAGQKLQSVDPAQRDQGAGVRHDDACRLSQSRPAPA
jgi:hypothetical protein